VGIEPTTSCSVGRRATIAPVRLFFLHPRDHKAFTLKQTLRRGGTTHAQHIHASPEVSRPRSGLLPEPGKERGKKKPATRATKAPSAPPSKGWQHATLHTLEFWESARRVFDGREKSSEKEWRRRAFFTGASRYDQHYRRNARLQNRDPLCIVFSPNAAMFTALGDGGAGTARGAPPRARTPSRAANGSSSRPAKLPTRARPLP
jgi:hypothetical protein